MDGESYIYVLVSHNNYYITLRHCHASHVQEVIGSIIFSLEYLATSIAHTIFPSSDYLIAKACLADKYCIIIWITLVTSEYMTSTIIIYYILVTVLHHAHTCMYTISIIH